MKPSEIYKWTPISVEKEIYTLEGHLNDVDYFYNVNSEKNEKIEIKTYVNHSSDGERGFNFFSVWFEDKPVMICEAAGRGNQDHRDGYITDGVLYKKMINYIQTVLVEVEDDINTYNPEEEIEGLGLFYSDSVLNHYNPDTVNPKYKKGDVVVVDVEKTHLSYTDKSRIQTRVKIERVSKYNPLHTYSGTQLDRNVVSKKDGEGKYIGCEVIDCKKGKGGLGAHFCDGEVIGLA